MPGNKWLEVAMIRMNHTGASMDAEHYDTRELGNVDEVVKHVKQVKAGWHGRDQHEADWRRRSSTTRTGRRRCGLRSGMRAWIA